VINAAVKAEMKKILSEIQSGEFATEFVGEVAAGGANFTALREAGKAHQIETVGADLRGMMPWISAGKAKVEDISGGD
jgi:ketol-acid reductoisomerase